MPTGELLGIATGDGSSGATLTVSSIPQTHKDLEVFFTGTDDNTAGTWYNTLFRLNGQTSGYDVNGLRFWYISGTSTDNNMVNTHGQSHMDIYCNGYGITTTGAAAQACIYLPEYTNTSSYQTWVHKTQSMKDYANWTGNWGSGYLYGDTSAITSVSVYTESAGNWEAGATLSVYGIDRTV